MDNKEQHIEEEVKFHKLGQESKRTLVWRDILRRQIISLKWCLNLILKYENTVSGPRQTITGESFDWVEILEWRNKYSIQGRFGGDGGL